jgi:hypothetical protein
MVKSCIDFHRSALIGKMVRTVTCILLITFSILTSKASAFDGNRKGFIIGFGLGVGITSTSNSDEVNYPDGSQRTFKDTHTRLAIMNDRKFGYAPNDLWEMYLTNKSAFTGNVDNSDGVIGFAVTKFSTSQLPAKFYTFGLGVPYMGTISWNFDSDNFGLFGGFGYEFRKHLNMEFDLLYGHRVRHIPRETETDNNLAFRFLLNVLAY